MDSKKSLSDYSLSKVIIAGGSIAGLTLAHALASQNVDFTILEAREEIALSIGASVCILANGARILDQLGLLDHIMEYATPMHSMMFWREDGGLMGCTDSLKLIGARSGYPPIMFLERQKLLQVLFERLPDRSRVLLNKRVVELRRGYAGGADGVRSVVHRVCLRGLDKKDVFENEKTCQYSAIFGISEPTVGMNPGQVNRTLAKDYSFFNAVSKSGHVFWFAFIGLKKNYRGAEIPRFDQSTIHEHVKPYLNKYQAKDVTLQSLWERTIRCSHVPVEEGVPTRWSRNSIVCIGDAVHKTTPNMGQGGSSAIESATSLANQIVALRETHLESCHQLHSTLDNWVRSRRPRLNIICKLGDLITRIEAGKTPFHRALAWFLASQQPGSLADTLCDAAVGADRIEYLPIPEKSLTGTMPFDPDDGLGPPNSATYNWLLSSILILCFGFILKRAGVYLFSGLGTNDQLPFPAQLADLGVLQTIWSMESSRFGNAVMPMALALPFTMVSHLNSGLVTSTCFALYHLAMPPFKLLVSDRRTLRRSYLNTLLPALVFAYYIPAFCISSPRIKIPSQLLLPVVFAAVHATTASFVTDTTTDNRINNPTADLKHIRAVYIFTTIISSFLWVYSDTNAGQYTFLQSFNIFGAMAWLVLEFRALKTLGRPRLSWLVIGSVVSLIVWILGPGAAVSLGWGIREELLCGGLRL